ncbi:glycosyltransferase [Marinobacter mobilis]|uniref:glycosyltransferase n=1 Tax=Marinobacter mobilis TaxID=488533 RepID=UPI0035C66FEF
MEVVISGNRLKRYLVGIFFTLKKLSRFSGNVVFFQNPSIILSMFMVVYRFFSSKKFVMDCHNAGLFPLEGASKILNALAIFIFKNVDCVIVTNSYLASYIDEKGGKAIVLSDPLPEFSDQRLDLRKKSDASYKALLVCTWAKDEPVMEVIEAVSRTKFPITLYVTGRAPKDILNRTMPSNVVLTGFVPDDKYRELMSGSDFVIDLTYRENCLVCGAYEAMAAGVPCIVSDFEVSRLVFRKGFVYSKNNSVSILESISFAIENLEELRESILNYRVEYQNNIREKIKLLDSSL